MGHKKMRGAAIIAATPHSQKCNAKIYIVKEITILLGFFRYTMGATTREAAEFTAIKRRSVCWYVADLQEMGLLKMVFIGRDRKTNRKAKHYSADFEAWNKYLKG
jgi:hypothetical protein